MMLLGPDLGVNATSSALACAQQCDVIPSCVAWAWDSCGGMKRGRRGGEEERRRGVDRSGERWGGVGRREEGERRGAEDRGGEGRGERGEGRGEREEKRGLIC